MSGEHDKGKNHKHEGHHHGHHHNHHHGQEAGKNILFAFLLNLGFAIFELVGGLYTGSVAVIADAVHDFGDSISLGISLILEKFSNKKRTDVYTYGYRRLSLLSSYISGVVITVGSIIVLYEAIPQFWNEKTPPNGLGMIGLAVVGLLVNGVAALRLKKGTSRNESMLSWHLIEDVLGWAAVLVGAIIITLTGWAWVDPLLACGVAIFVLYNVSRNLWQTIQIFLQRRPDGFDETLLIQAVLKIQDVTRVRDVHAWSLDGESNVLSIAVEVQPHFEFGNEFTELKSKIKEVINSMGNYHTTIEIEKAVENQKSCEL